MIIGGGAAGFFCAVNAAALNSELKVIIVEKSNKLLTKVKVSGGGRCNVTHACYSIAEMVKNYPRGSAFLKKAFHHFFTTDTIKWFEQRGIKLKAEADGRMFPVTDSSETIINCLVQEANKYGVEILMNREVMEIQSLENKKCLVLRNGEVLEADHVCIACGGFAKASQFDWLKLTGHTIETPVPSLFTFNIPNDPIKELMGVSLPNVHVKIQGTKLSQQGPILITHWGFSGPAVLKLSSFAARELAERKYEFIVQINWLGNATEQTLINEMQALRFKLATQKVVNKNPFQLPQRLWEYLITTTGIKEDIRWADLPAKQQNSLAKLLCSQQFNVKGKTTFKEEFVTAGGIELGEIDVNTMESRIVKDIYFAGEIMNVDGITGGFNFQHAWTSGWIAAKAISSIK